MSSSKKNRSPTSDQDGGAAKGKRAARDRLAAERKRQERSRRKRKQSTGVLWVVVAVVAAAIIGYAWWAANDSGGPTTAALPPLVNEQSGGVVLGSGPVDVDVWIDFQCPICKQYEATNGDMLQKKVQSDEITLTVHPLSFLDDSLHNQSSKLAANAFGCATESGGDTAYDFSLAVYRSQPPEQEGQEAWSADELVGIGNDVGLQGDAWESCVRDGKYDDWVQQVAASQLDEGVTGTPTVFVDGSKVAPTDDLEAAIASASG